MSTLKLENIKHENSSTNNMVMDSDGSTRTTGTLKVNDRLQVGDASITQQYTGLGYVADFQASSGSQTFISISEPGASTVGNTGVIIGEDTNNTYITQRGNKPINIATSDTNQIIVDGSGRVTMPNQPMACAGSTMGGAGSNLHPASTIYVQKGGTNLAANGRFTCPIAGVYRVTLTGYTNYTNGYGYIYLKKNGSQQGYNHHFNHNANNYQFHSIVAMSQLVDCSASDYLEFWGGAGNGYVHYSLISFELVG